MEVVSKLEALKIGKRKRVIRTSVLKTRGEVCSSCHVRERETQTSEKRLPWRRKSADAQCSSRTGYQPTPAKAETSLLHFDVLSIPHPCSSRAVRRLHGLNIAPTSVQCCGCSCLNNIYHYRDGFL